MRSKLKFHEDCFLGISIIMLYRDQAESPSHADCVGFRIMVGRKTKERPASFAK